jgi:hypothetical protein
MGNLAMRYLDASRSGVYRVTDAAVPSKAAVEAGSILTRLDAGAGAFAILETLRVEPGRNPRVVIIDGADALAQEHARDFQSLVAALDGVASERRARDVPFYAVLTDPRRILALPTLYKEPGVSEAPSRPQ